MSKLGSISVKDLFNQLNVNKEGGSKNVLDKKDIEETNQKNKQILKELGITEDSITSLNKRQLKSRLKRNYEANGDTIDNLLERAQKNAEAVTQNKEKPSMEPTAEQNAPAPADESQAGSADAANAQKATSAASAQGSEEAEETQKDDEVDEKDDVDDDSDADDDEVEGDELLQKAKANPKFLGKVALNANKSFKTLFKNADKDNSGGLNATEITEVLKKFGLGKYFSAEKVMKEVGTNDKGEVAMDNILSYANSLGYGDWDEDTKLGSAVKDAFSE